MEGLRGLSAQAVWERSQAVLRLGFEASVSNHPKAVSASFNGLLSSVIADRSIGDMVRLISLTKQMENLMNRFALLLALAVLWAGCGTDSAVSKRGEEPTPSQAPEKSVTNEGLPAAETTGPRRKTTHLTVIGDDPTLRSSGGGLDSLGDGLNARKKDEKTTALAGFCPKEAINIPMRKQISSFQACYEKELAKNRTLEGRVDSHFSVNEDGKAIDVSTTGLPRVGACIADVIRNIQFEWRHGCHNIKWPFVFKSK